jgi:hypothetical protein
MADLTAMMQAAAGGVGGEPIDADFANTVLLLHGDGTNGAQNNTFLDSSTNNFTITRNGNTTQGTFSPFSKPDGRFGNFFDGTDDYLSVADNAVLRPGAGAFTLEAWIYRAAAGAAHTIYAKGGASTGINFQVTSGNVLRFTHTTTNIDSTGTVSANAWVHVAVVREGTGSNQTKLYINGTNDGQGTVSTDFTQTEEVRIGTNRSAGDDFSGYISNVRFVKGSALYTGNFTPSTSPFTTTSQGASSSEVELLTCQSNRFIDNSSNAFAITRNGDVKVTPFSPFPITTAYDTSVNGGAGYFDGSGDFLTVPSDVDFQFGSGNFTMELNLYAASASFGNRTFLQYGLATVTGWTELSWGLSTDASGNPFFEVSNGVNNPQFTITSSVALTPFSWNHIAIARSGNDFTLYLNGASVGTTNSSFSLYDPGASSLFHIGRAHNNATSRDWPGYISNLRVVKGTAVYTSAFTPPTAPLTAIANTSLLCNFTNAGIFDNTGFNALETVADAQIDTTTKKYGTGSIEFDGTGDWLLMANTPDQQLGTGNFTIEFWVYLATGDIGSNRGLVAKGGASTGFLVSLNTTEKVVFTFTTSTITSSGAITTNAWNHIAVVREGTGSNQTKIYINGTNDGTGTVSTDFNQTEVMYVGCNRVAGDPMKGYIDDLRITKGIARYTTTFTPPTAAFPNIGA